MAGRSLTAFEADSALAALHHLKYTALGHSQSTSNVFALTTLLPKLPHPHNQPPIGSPTPDALAPPPVSKLQQQGSSHQANKLPTITGITGCSTGAAGNLRGNLRQSLPSHQGMLPSCSQPCQVTPVNVPTNSRLPAGLCRTEHAGSLQWSSQLLCSPAWSFQSPTYKHVACAVHAQLQQCAAMSAARVRSPHMSLARRVVYPPSFVAAMQDVVLQPPKAPSEAPKRGPKSILYFFEVDRPHMGTFEKLYWLTLLSVLLYLLVNKIRGRPTPEQIAEKERKAAELEARRQENLRSVMAGISFLEGDDLFEGLTPKQIEEYVQKSRTMLGIDTDEDDPYEGMTPEEIDEYARTHGLQA